MKLREGYHTITPYLVVPDGGAQIEFLKQAFGGVETMCAKGPDGRIMHAEVRIGDSLVMLGEAGGQWAARQANILVYVEDTDAVYAKALAAGGKSLREPVDQPYGDRSAGVEDPWGNVWWISTMLTEGYKS